MPVFHKDLVARLRSRRWEIEQALLARISALPGAPRNDDPEYREQVRLIVPAAFDFSLAVIESPEGEPPPIPAEFLLQARLAARHRIGLDIILRGYAAGSALVDDFILDECDGESAQVLLRLKAAALQNLLSQVSAEYEVAQRTRFRSRDAQALETIRRLLRGEPQSSLTFDYDLRSNHVALIARGGDPKRKLSEAFRGFDCRMLIVRVDSETAWGWVGRRTPLHLDEVDEVISRSRSRDITVGIGEPAHGIAGWRTTHRQARAALRVAMNRRGRLARYDDACLLATAMQDDLLASSLRRTFIEPLLTGGDGGEAHLRTLRAYFGSQRNGESTASALGVSRQAVASRLTVIEGRIGRPLHECSLFLEVALQLEELNAARAQDEWAARASAAATTRLT